MTAWSHVPTKVGVSVPGPMFLPGRGLCPEGSLPREVSAQGGGGGESL